MIMLRPLRTQHRECGAALTRQGDRSLRSSSTHGTLLPSAESTRNLDQTSRFASNYAMLNYPGNARRALLLGNALLLPWVVAPSAAVKQSPPTPIVTIINMVS